jgi:hypothetical protein
VVHSSHYLATTTNSQEDSPGVDPPRYITSLPGLKYVLIQCRYRRGNRCWICRLLNGPKAGGRQADSSFSPEQKGLEDEMTMERWIDAILEISVLGTWRLDRVSKEGGCTK